MLMGAAADADDFQSDCSVVTMTIMFLTVVIFSTMTITMMFIIISSCMVIRDADALRPYTASLQAQMVAGLQPQCPEHVVCIMLSIFKDYVDLCGTVTDY